MVTQIETIDEAKMKNGAHYDYMDAALDSALADAVVDGDHDYKPFINAMNQQIERYRQQVLTSKKKKAEEKKEETAE